MTDLQHLGPAQRLESVVGTAVDILTGMGIEGVTPDSVLSAPRFYDGPVLLENTDRVGAFMAQLAVRMRFVGYPPNDIAFVTVRELGEVYLRESYPDLPTARLPDEDFELDVARGTGSAPAIPKDFPIAFVLGCPRSGTTLLRTMLDVHEGLWAPGELQFASYVGMADRAASIMPLLRFMPLPELAARLGESTADASRRFRAWELEDTPVEEVYQRLHDADPSTMIVDKTPTYGDRLSYLERIGRAFPNARFIHLVRSPHDVIRSVVRMQLYKGVQRRLARELSPYHVGEIIWCAQESNIRRFLAGVPGERQYRVRYEDLVADPTPALTAICELLGRPFDPRMADPYAGSKGRVARGAGDMQVNLLDRVQPRTAAEALYPVGARCQELASAFGY